jgi:methionyl-tRNA formyltransferase
VKAIALSHGIDVRQPLSLRSPEAQVELAELAPDLMIVVAYGLMLPPAVLATPRLGCINVHASLLPRWRGAAPIERAILAGDVETGISIMQMDSGLDTGPILATAKIPVTGEDNSGTLTLKLQDLGCISLLNVVDAMAKGAVHPVPQDNQLATYARKLSKGEAGIVWTAAATIILQQIRGFYPRSPAYCLYHGQRLRIIKAKEQSHTYASYIPGTIVDISQDTMLIACGTGALAVSEVQLEGKSPMTLPQLLNGYPDYFQPGSQLLSAAAHAQST